MEDNVHIIDVDPNWRCVCPHCSNVLIDMRCTDVGSTLVPSLLQWLKRIVFYGAPLLGLFAWLRWKYYYDKLKCRRDEYKVARDERKQLECKLRQIEFMEGRKLGDARSAGPAVGSLPKKTPQKEDDVQRKLMLGEIKRLHGKINQNETQLTNLNCQKLQLIEELADAERVLDVAVSKFDSLREDQPYGDSDADSEFGPAAASSTHYSYQPSSGNTSDYCDKYVNRIQKKCRCHN